MAVGDALARLVSAESALFALDVQDCRLGDDGLRLLFASVAQNMRLRMLDCRLNNISPEFACGTVLPAVQSNTSLRKLQIMNGPDAGLEEAEVLVKARSTPA
jgi:hypothetical protein